MDLESCCETSSVASETFRQSDSAGVASGAAGSSSGIVLKTKISMVGRNPSVVVPFYTFIDDLPQHSPLTGSMDLLSYYGLDHAYSKFCSARKKELSGFLSYLPGVVDSSSQQDPASVTAQLGETSLQGLLERPPVQKPIEGLSTTALAGFRLQPGMIPEQYRVMALDKELSVEKKKHKKKKRNKNRYDSASLANNGAGSSAVGGLSTRGIRKHDSNGKLFHDEHEKKKKRKKDKKKKKSTIDHTDGQETMHSTITSPMNIQF